MNRNKKHFIIWKLMMSIPVIIGIWFIYFGWILNDLMGALLIFGGILGIVLCGSFILFYRYNPKQDWVARSVGGKL